MSASGFDHIMVDLETMGSRPGSVIASIGAVSFNPITGEIGHPFYRTVSLASAAAAGLRFDADTVKWWLQQGDAARKALFEDDGSLADALTDFTDFWAEEGGTFFWSHGANFDDPILAEAFLAAGFARPWKYWDSRCTRTLFDLAGVKPDRAAGVHHTALDDAKAQAAAVIEAYRRLGLADGCQYRTISGSLIDIAVERERQKTVEGWSAEHDDGHDHFELARAAAYYALATAAEAHPSPALDDPSPRYSLWGAADNAWPWEPRGRNTKGARRNLLRAGALIAAEIDRLDRKVARNG